MYGSEDQNQSSVVPPLPWLEQGAPVMAQQPWATKSYTFPFVRREGRTHKKDKFSPFRTGEIMLAEQGVHLRGKAVMVNAGLGYLAFGLLGALVAEMVRKQQEYWFTWELIERITLEPRKQRAAIAYCNPKAPKQVLGLAFALGDRYNEFAQAATTLAPTKVSEGKILKTNLLVVFAVVIVLVIVVIAAALLSSQK